MSPRHRLFARFLRYHGYDSRAFWPTREVHPRSKVMIKEPIIFDLWGGLEYEELEREGIYQTTFLFDLSASNTIHLSKAKGMETEQSVLKIFFSAVDAAQWFAVPVRHQSSSAVKETLFLHRPFGPRSLDTYFENDGVYVLSH